MSFTVPQISPDLSQPFAATPYRAKPRPMTEGSADPRPSEVPIVKVPVDALRGRHLDTEA